MDRILLEESCEILDSRRIPITASNRKEGPYPYYGANGIQDYVDDYIFDDELVLLAEDGGNFGSKERPIAYRVSGKCWVNNHAHVLKPKDGMNVDYLCYSLMFYDTEKLVNGATRQKLTQAMMRKILIPKRSISEQKKIVDTLNTIQNSIAKQTKRIKLLDNLIKARFVEMFGENDATSKVLIGDAVELINGRAFKPTDWTPTGLPIIRIQNLNDTKAPYNYFYGAYDKKNYIKSGELLFSWSGTPGTSFGAFIWNRGPGLLNQHIFRVLPKKDYDLNFLRFALNAQLDEIISKAHGGVGLQHITKSELEKIAIPYPNRKLQAAFSAFVAQIDKSKFAVQKSLEKTQLLFDSLMQEYFG